MFYICTINNQLNIYNMKSIRLIFIALISLIFVTFAHLMYVTEYSDINEICCNFIIGVVGLLIFTLATIKNKTLSES